MSTLTLINTFDIGKSVTYFPEALRFSPDSTLLAVGTHEETMLYDVGIITTP